LLFQRQPIKLEVADNTGLQGPSMLGFISASLVWLQKRLLWSNSWESWKERLAVTSLAAAALLAWWYAGRLAQPQQVVLWGALLIAAAILFRRGWVKLFGPVLLSDMVRTARRRNQIILRLLYSVLLAYIFIIVYFLTVEQQTSRGGFDPFSQFTLPPTSMGDFTNLFFYWYMAIQGVAIFLLTPPYTAGAVAAEKERQSFDALLATDLRNREIVLSLYLSRMANLAMVLLTGLPILMLLEFLGGLDPYLVLSGFAVTGLTMASLGSLGILQSIQSVKPRAAILWTYFWVLLYLAVASASWLLLMPELELATFPSTDDWASPVTVKDVVTWLNAGNPFSALILMVQDIRSGATLDHVLPPLLRSYAWFHGAVTATCLTWAVARMRASALKQVSQNAHTASTRGQALPRRRLVPLPKRLTASPLVWKEIIVDSGRRGHWYKWLGMGLLIAVIFFPAVHMVFWFGSLPSFESWGDGLKDSINFWARIVTVLISFLTLVQVAMRASGAVSGERARQTMDGLLTTPQSAFSILFAKWLGSIFSSRWLWVLLGVVWALGLYTGALTVQALAMFLLAWSIYAAFLTGLGLYFSIVSRSTQRATLWTLVVAALVMAAAYLLAWDLSDYWKASYQLIPFVALYYIPTVQKTETGSSVELMSQAEARSLGLLLWLALAVFLWFLANHRFRVSIGRGRRRRKKVAPELSPAIPTIRISAPSVAAPSVVAATWSVKPLFSRPDEDPPSLRPRRPWRYRLVPIVLALAPLGVMLAIFFHHAIDAEERWQNAVADTDRLDPGWRWEDLEAKRQVIPDEENSGLLLTRWHKTSPFRDGYANWPGPEFEQLFQVDPEPQFQLNEAQTKFLIQLLAKVPQPLDEARKLADMPRGRHPLVMSKDDFWPLLDSTQKTREMANFLGYDVWLRAQQGDIDGALASCRGILNAERSIGDEPTLISMLVRVAIRAIAIRKIERTLAQGEASEEALKTLQVLLELEEAEVLLLNAMRGERSLSDRILRAMEKKGNSLSSMEAIFGAGGGGQSAALEQLRMFFSSPLKSQRAALLRYNNQMVEIAKVPSEQQPALLTQMNATMANQPVLVRMLAASVDKVAAAGRRSQAELRSAVVMIAVDRFRLKYHRWPNKLEELVPEFLPRIPIDPWDGMRLRYRFKQTKDLSGVVIYSVGPDRRDDGGNIQITNPLTAGTDIGVRLWDVSKRRQPAPPPKAGTPDDPES
jgi:ABC-type transport system involved in multi-copper enzyme maturation permease subunit